MKFEKGHEKAGGRKAGTPNKSAIELRQQLQTIVQVALDELPDTMATMEPHERAKLLTALLPYVMPKLTAIDLPTLADVPVRKRPEWLSIASEPPSN